MPDSRVLYLHGFASGPTSSKAQFCRRQFSNHGIELIVPDLAEGSFERLTISGQLAVIQRETKGEPVRLIGSSHGGYLAALYASQHPEVERLILLAPAFHFPHRWLDELGPETAGEWKRTRKLPVFNYSEARDRNLDYQFYEDAQQYTGAPDFAQPALIIHGTRDGVVPLAYSQQYAAAHSNVRLLAVDSDHQLTDKLDVIWRETSAFLSIGV